jgi:hypothetical protein
MSITGLLILGALLSGCTMYTQDADGNVVATIVVPVPLPVLEDGDYAPVVSDYVGLPFLGAWDGGYYSTGYFHANWSHASYYHGADHRNWNRYRRGVAWHGPDGGGAAWHGTRGGGAVVVRSGVAGGITVARSTVITSTNQAGRI